MVTDVFSRLVNREKPLAMVFGTKPWPGLPYGAQISRGLNQRRLENQQSLATGGHRFITNQSKPRLPVDITDGHQVLPFRRCIQQFDRSAEKHGLAALIDRQ